VERQNAQGGLAMTRDTQEIAGAAASFSTDFWDLAPGHKPDISLEKYKAVIKLLVAATVGCQGANN
jgi:hypothetical protein